MTKDLFLEARTPVGFSSWCALNPEAPDTKFGSKWYVDLVVPKNADTKEFVQKAEGLLAQARKHFGEDKPVVALPIKEHVDAEGNKTGDLVIRVKLITEGENKQTGRKYKNTLKLIGADLKPFVPEGTIGMGTKMCVVCYMSGYSGRDGVGITFKIKSAQIIDVKYYGGGEADASDYEAHEGNAVSEEPSAPQEVSTSSFDFAD
jgi:hypothetical protein